MTGNELIVVFAERDALPTPDGGYPGGESPTLQLLQSLPEHTRASSYVPEIIDRLAESWTAIDDRGLIRAWIIGEVAMLQKQAEMRGDHVS